MALWHWHPVFVHFSAALLSTASVLFIVSAYGRERLWGQNCLITARWTFWIGIFMLALTAAAGLVAYFTVPLGGAGARELVNTHAVVAILTAALYLIMAVFLWRRQKNYLPPTTAWTLTLILGLVLIGCTGYLGGNLVYRHGIGVTAGNQ